MRRTLPLLLACVFLILAPGRIPAGDLQDFDSAMADAYNHYRHTLFYLRTDNPMVASLELDALATKWETLMTHFGSSPPRPYASDPLFGKSLDEVRARVEDALSALDQGDTTRGRELLMPIRRDLSEMRRRSGVVSFSDHIDELSAAMEVLVRYRREIRNLDDNTSREQAERQAAIVATAFEKIRRMAPPEIAQQEEFQRTLEGVRESMERLHKGLEKRDGRLFRIGVGELHAHERLLYLRFG